MTTAVTSIESSRTGIGRLRVYLAACVIALCLPMTDGIGATRIYPAPAQAAPQLNAALAQARDTHRRVLLVFGANWCLDCRQLETALKKFESEHPTDFGYVVVHVDVGRFDENLPLAGRYGIEPRDGIPALAVVDADGHLVHAQQGAEIEHSDNADPGTVAAFLQRWRTAAPDRPVH